MKTYPPSAWQAACQCRMILSLALSIASLSLSPAVAQSNWNLTTGGSWNTSTNWSTNPTIPDSSSVTVNFTQNFSGSPIITLDNAAGFTVNRVNYNDTGASSDSTLAISTGTGGKLTLAGTTPTIDVTLQNPVTSGLTINAVIDGTAGFTKTGDGRLTLAGTNTYSGTTTINHATATTDATGVIITNSSAFGSSDVLILGRQNFNYSLQVNSGLVVNNALTLRRGGGNSNRAVLRLESTAEWAGNITLDNTSGNGLAVIAAGGTNATNASIVSGNIGSSALGTGTSLTIRSGWGRVSGSVSLAGGLIQLVDSSNWEFTNASNAWGTLEIANANGFIQVGATNTLASAGVVTSAVGGTLRLNNQAATTACDQTIAGLSGNVNVTRTVGTPTLTLNTTANQTHTGVISSTISLVKTGSAIQNLTGANTYTGGTTINAGTLSFGNDSLGTTGSITINGGTLQWNGTNTQDISDHLTLQNGGSATLDTNGNNVSLASSFGGSASSTVTKTGTGVLTLIGTNTFSGAFSISAGTVRAGSASAIGTNATLVALGGASGSVFAAAGATAITFTKSVSTNTADGGITFGDATGTGNLTFTGNLTRAPGSSSRTINVAGSTNVTFNGNLLSPGANSTTSFFKGGTGTLTILGTGNAGDVGFSNIIVTGGTLAVSRLANLGSASSLGTAANATAGAVSITLDGGELSYIGGGAASTTNRQLQIGRTTAGAVGTIRNNATSASETITFSNTNAIAYGTADQTRSLILGGSNTGANTLTSVINDNGTGVVSLTKQDVGRWGLSGTNNYTGTTTISAGTLSLSSTGTTGTGAVTAQNGSTILGTGTVRGSTFTAESGSTVHAGDGTAQSNYGTLNFTPASGSGSFDFQSGSSIILGINPGGVGDLLNFNGLSNGSLLFNGNLQITATGYVPTSTEIFNLLDWSNLSTTTFASRYSAGSYSGLLFGNGDDNLGFDLPDISGSGFGWDISQFIINGTIAVVIVPEPSRALLLAAGLALVLTRRHRRMTAK